MVRSLVEPLPLPMALFSTKWKSMDESFQRSHISSANVRAHNMLPAHSLQHHCPAILGKPLHELQTDYKFSSSLAEHVHAGEVLAQAAFQTELLVCRVAGVKHTLYIGRSQYPKIQCKPSRHKHSQDDKFTSPAANFRGILGHVLESYMSLRTKHVQQGNVYDSGVPLLGQSRELRAGPQQAVPLSGQSASALRADGCQIFSSFFLRKLEPLDRKIRVHCWSLSTQGSACTPGDLKRLREEKVPTDIEWKGPEPDFVQLAEAKPAFPHGLFFCYQSRIHNTELWMNSGRTTMPPLKLKPLRAGTSHSIGLPKTK